MRGSVKGSASFAQHSTLIPKPELPCLREADAWGNCPNVKIDLSHDQLKKGWWTCPGSNRRPCLRDRRPYNCPLRATDNNSRTTELCQTWVGTRRIELATKRPLTLITLH